MSSGDSHIQRGGEGTLYNLLLERFPKHRGRGGILDATGLGKDLDLSHESMYRIMRRDVRRGYPNGKLTVNAAIKIMDLSAKLHPENRIYIEDLLPFVCPNFEAYSRDIDPLA